MTDIRRFKERSPPKNAVSGKRFRLRTLMLLVLLSGVLLSYPAWVLRRSAQDQALVRRLNAPEAQVDYRQLGPTTLRWVLPVENSRVVSSIHFWQCDCRNVRWEVLREFQHLRQFGLRAVNIRDAEFARIGVLSEVDDLNIAQTPLTDRSIRELARWPKLRRLNMIGTQATPRSWQALQSAPALEQVETSYFSPRRLSALGVKIDALRFDVSIFPATTAIEPQRTATEGSARLDIQAALIDANGENPSVNLGSNWEDAHLAALRHFPSVTALTLSSNNITDEGMHSLGTLTKLKSLDINAGDISNAGLQSIGNMTGLTRLSIALPMMSDEGLRTIGQCTNLESLTLHGNVTTDGLTFLPQLTKLRELHLGNTKVDGRLVPILQQCPSLRHLLMTSGLCEDADLRNFASLTQLQELFIMGGPFRSSPSAETLRFLAKRLPACKGVQ